jgi:hypothetical protein
MSAPNQGRQSPDPENQSSAQKDTPASGQVDAAPSDTHAKDKSEEAKSDGGVLESNHVHPLKEAAEAKLKKGEGNDIGA